MTLHQTLQHHLLSSLPNALAERRFPSIGRIADVCWSNLIFEIQCSPIDPQEALGRVHDYASLGYQTVWILSDTLYNQPRISQLEWALQPHPHYFASPTTLIYDQWDLHTRGHRTKGPPIPIRLIPLALPTYPHLLATQRRSQWPIAFTDDLTHRLHTQRLDAGPLRALETPPRQTRKRLLEAYRRWLRARLSNVG
jgi:hypothetical protein